MDAAGPTPTPVDVPPSPAGEGDAADSPLQPVAQSPLRNGGGPADTSASFADSYAGDSFASFEDEGTGEASGAAQDTGEPTRGGGDTQDDEGSSVDQYSDSFVSFDGDDAADESKAHPTVTLPSDEEVSRQPPSMGSAKSGLASPAVAALYDVVEPVDGLSEGDDDLLDTSELDSTLSVSSLNDSRLPLSPTSDDEDGLPGGNGGDQEHKGTSGDDDGTTTSPARPGPDPAVVDAITSMLFQELTAELGDGAWVSGGGACNSRVPLFSPCSCMRDASTGFVAPAATATADEPEPELAPAASSSAQPDSAGKDDPTLQAACSPCPRLRQCPAWSAWDLCHSRCP